MKKNNDGPPAVGLAITGLIAGAKALALKVGAKVALKSAAKLGTKAIAKAGTKAAAKATTKQVAKKALGKTLTKKAGEQTAKKIASKTAQTAKKAAKQAGNMAEGKAPTFKEGVKDLYNQGKNKISQGVDKYSNLTGQSREEGLNTLKSNAAQKGVEGAKNLASKLSEPDPTEASSVVSSENTATDPNGEITMNSYTNPQGPSAYFNPKTGPSMRKGLKYDNFGASLQGTSKTTSGQIKSNPPVLSSLNSSNIQGSSAKFSSLGGSNIKNPSKTPGQKGLDFIKGINANVNVKGFNFNIGQTASILSTLGQGAVNKVKAKKLTKLTNSKVVANKQSAAQAKKEATNQKIMQNIDYMKNNITNKTFNK